MAGSNEPSGVRGPGGPPRRSTGRQAQASGAKSEGRQKFEDASRPLIVGMHRAPRWLVVVTPAILLFAGLIVPWGIVGGLLLLLIAALLLWLVALSWPAIGAGSRFVRLLVVVAIGAIAVLRLTGRF